MADVAADLAERGGRTGSALWRWRPLAYLAEALAAEGDRRILWLPVFFATGIALYFTPTVVPPWWLGLAATAAALIPAAPELRLRGRRRIAPRADGSAAPPIHAAPCQLRPQSRQGATP